MRNDSHFQQTGASEPKVKSSIGPTPFYSSEISLVLDGMDQSRANRYIMLMSILDVLKKDREIYKTAARKSPLVEKSMIKTMLSVSKEINALRQKNSDLTTLVKGSDRYTSGLTKVLSDLEAIKTDRVISGLSTSLTSKLVANITRNISEVEVPTMHLAAALPLGKPPPQNSSSGLVKAGNLLRSAWSSAAKVVLPFSKRTTAALSLAAVTALPASTGIIIANSETISIAPLPIPVIEPTPIAPPAAPILVRNPYMPRNVGVSNGLAHPTSYGKNTGEQVATGSKSAVRRVKENLDDLFHKPEILAIALDKLQNLKIDAAFKKAVLVESGDRQFDAAGNTLKSHKGATGRAQVMPDTAEKYAKACTGAALDNDRFHNDAEYNYNLGKCYYKARAAVYDGNPVMAALDYNWGPKGMERHIKRVGDPTQGEISMVKFIQTLPVEETRHYTLHMLKKGGLLQEAEAEHNQAQAAAPTGP